jgi:hypothetical protein
MTDLNEQVQEFLAHPSEHSIADWTDLVRKMSWFFGPMQEMVDLVIEAAPLMKFLARTDGAGDRWVERANAWLAKAPPGAVHEGGLPRAS